MAYYFVFVWHKYSFSLFAARVVGGEAFITLQTLKIALFGYCYEDG